MLARATEPPPLLHPNMAELYRQRIAALHERLQSEETKAEAANFRKLIALSFHHHCASHSQCVFARFGTGGSALLDGWETRRLTTSIQWISNNIPTTGIWMKTPTTGRPVAASTRCRYSDNCGAWLSARSVQWS